MAAFKLNGKGHGAPIGNRNAAGPHLGHGRAIGKAAGIGAGTAGVAHLGGLAYLVSHPQVHLGG